MDLLAAEIIAVTGKSPSQLHEEQVAKYGALAYARIDAAATKAEKAKLGALSPEGRHRHRAGWRAHPRQARRGAWQRCQDWRSQGRDGERLGSPLAPGTEDVYKIYGESFNGPEHLAQVQEEAKAVVSAALNG